MPESRVRELVSVVIPIYNAERFLAEAVDSVLAQTYPQWELLLVDDGSADSSPAIAGRYADSDPARIRCLEHPGQRNVGVCASRNLGMRHSRGEYIALLDADDIWLPHKLEQQVALMNAYPEAALLYGHSIYFDDGRGPESEQVPPLAPAGKLYRPPDLLKLTYPLGPAGAPCPSSFLMRRELIEQTGGFDESFKRWEDVAFLSKVYLRAPVFVAANRWDRYRRHDASRWARGVADGEHRSRRFYLDWLQRYLEQEGVRDAEIQAGVARLTWPYRHPALASARRIVRGAVRRVLRRKR